jgi:tetratricopeptide (TPR) repeat protein
MIRHLVVFCLMFLFIELGAGAVPPARPKSQSAEPTVPKSQRPAESGVHAQSESGKETRESQHARARELVSKAREMYLMRPPQFNRAIEFYKESLKIEDDPFTRTKLAQMLKFAERYDEAEAEYVKVRQIYRKRKQAVPFGFE